MFKTDASDKETLRAELKRARSGMSEPERAQVDAAIARVLVQLPEYECTSTVFAYNSFGAEVDTHAIIARALDQGTTVALPRCVPRTRTMRWYRIDSLDGLERSALGVLEPKDDPDRLLDPSCDAAAVALVPALSFDSQGYRLGYGGGFYDAFLAGFPGTSIGLCRSCLQIDDLAAHGAREPHDERVNIVVSDAGAVRVS